MRHTNLSRRTFMAGLGATASLPLLGAAPAWARLRVASARQAQGSLLPINTPKIDHLDVIVPDVAASARLYMGGFNTRLHAQPFQGGFRYFVLFGDLPANRQVGYLAIGDSRGRGTYIGHFCTSICDSRQGGKPRQRRLARTRDVYRSLLHVDLRLLAKQRGDHERAGRGRRQGGTWQADDRQRTGWYLFRPRWHRDPVPPRA